MSRTLAVVLLILIGEPAVAETSADKPDWTAVSAIFLERCVMCHSELGAARGLRLDTYDLARAGGINGPVLIPADASNSELIRRLRGESLPRMPFLGRPLSPEQIDLIVRWVDAGLPNSVGNATAPVGADETSHLQQEIAPPRAPFTTP